MTIPQLILSSRVNLHSNVLHDYTRNDPSDYEWFKI